MRNRIRGFSEGSQLTKTSRRNQLTVEVDFSSRIPGIGCLLYPNEVAPHFTERWGRPDPATLAAS
jgi:hypothetical protein